MRKLVYYIGLSVDGYLAGPDEEIDFYPVSADHLAHMTATHPEVLPGHVRVQVGAAAEPNRMFDTVVMGRRTYDPALRAGITSPYAHLRQIVFSRSLPRSPDPQVTVTDRDPVAVVRELKAEDGLDIYLAGGGVLAGALLDEIDRMIVKKYPVVAGSGLPAFVAAFRPTPFTLVEQRSFDSGATVLTLDRAG